MFTQSMFTQSELATLIGLSIAQVSRRIKNAGIKPIKQMSKGGRLTLAYDSSVLAVFPQYYADVVLKQKPIDIELESEEIEYRIEVIEDVGEDLDEDTFWGFTDEWQNEAEVLAALKETLAMNSVIGARIEKITTKYSNWKTK